MKKSTLVLGVFFVFVAVAQATLNPADLSAVKVQKTAKHTPVSLIKNGEFTVLHKNLYQRVETSAFLSSSDST